MTTPRRPHKRAAMLLGGLLGIAGCGGQPHESPPVAAAPGPAMQPAVAAAPAASVGPDDKPTLFNDPPAAPDTPLCGREAQERNAIGMGLQGAAVASSGICRSFACYDPLTATYIGADGYRHVCR